MVKIPLIQSIHKIKILRQNCAKGNDQELMKSVEQTGEQGTHRRAEGRNPNGVREERGQSSAHGEAAPLNWCPQKGLAVSE